MIITKNCDTINPFIMLKTNATQPRQESNSDLKFRKLLFYPLNYGASAGQLLVRLGKHRAWEKVRPVGLEPTTNGL